MTWKMDDTVLWATCHACTARIWWQDCPIGGWWVHETTPEDGHDPENYPVDEGEMYPF